MDIGKLVSGSWEKFSANLVQAIILYLVGGLIGGFLSGLTLGIAGIPVFAGLYKAFRKFERGETADFSDLFGEFSNFSKWFMVWVVMIGAALVTALTFGLAGIILPFVLFFMFPLMIEKDMQAMDAAKESFNKVKDNIGGLIVPMLVVMILAAAGGIVFGVGALLTAPWMMIGAWMVYDYAYGAAE